MKNLVIGANWKSNKTKNEAKEWLNKFYEFTPREGLEIILFPPSTLLDYVSSIIRVNDLSLKVGAQDGGVAVAKSVTGGLRIEQITEFAEFILIGHSETRSLNDKKLIDAKMKEVLSFSSSSVIIKSILCISKLEELDTIIEPDQIVAFEPIEAIGTGTPQDSGKVEEMVREIRMNKNVSRVMYGGSVNSENIKNYLSIDVDGFLIGNASLDAREFISLLKNV